MGVDLQDLHFRIERRFGVRFDLMAAPGWVIRPGNWDITAGDLCHYLDEVRAGIGPLPQRVHARRPGAGGSVVLGYESQELPPPTAGTLGPSWAGLQEVIAEMLNVPRERVRPESWLVQDLEMC